ncbi:MAG: hypothetical protein K2P58_01060 [Hyphomonadaceae bacterium]|nr:hypothetical protein [Hyphomonadaceae bacterium]
MSTRAGQRPAVSKQQRKNLYLIGTLVATVIMVAGAAIAGRVSVPVGLALVLPAMVAVFAFSFLWFAALDELAQRAHYEAWFWGGSTGLLVAPLLIVSALLTGGQSDLVELALTYFGGGDNAREAFLNGVMVAIVPPVIGYGIWWLVFWLRKL